MHSLIHHTIVDFDDTQKKIKQSCFCVFALFWWKKLLKRTTAVLLTIFACVLQHSLCCSWIYWWNPLPSHPAKRNRPYLVQHTHWIIISNLTLWLSHLLAGVPVQSRPLQDEPETLPLLGDEDAALFSLLPQPAVTVGHAQLAARHAASTHGCCHSCKDRAADVTLYREKQRFYFTFQRAFLSVFLRLKLERKAALFQFVLKASLHEDNSLSGFCLGFNFASSLTICPTISGQELMLAVSGWKSWGEGLLIGWKGDGLLGDGDLSSLGLGESLKLSNSPEGIKFRSCTLHRILRANQLSFLSPEADRGDSVPWWSWYDGRVRLSSASWSEANSDSSCPTGCCWASGPWIALLW